MTRLTGILSLALASFTSYSVFASPGPTQTLFTPIEATVEIGNGYGDGADGVDVGLEVRLYFCIFIIYSDILIIFFQICGSSGCCQTDSFKHWATDDWSRGDTEEWGSNYFGECKTKKFDVCLYNLEVTIWKDAGDDLNVKQITLVLEQVGNANFKT